jgi:hypothetical protein
MIPHFLVDSGGFTTYFYISNITDANVPVEVDFYSRDGSLVLDGNNESSGDVRAYGGNYSSYIESYTETVAFNLGPHQTITLHLMPRAWDAGYGEIRWSQTGSATEALVAHGRAFRMLISREMSYDITINGGKAF